MTRRGAGPDSKCIDDASGHPGSDQHSGAQGDKRDEALRAMDEGTLKWADADFFVTLHAAEFYAVLGDTSKGIEWLDRAVRKGDERVEWFRKNPRLASIRNDPSFQRIIDSIQARRKQRQRK